MPGSRTRRASVVRRALRASDLIALVLAYVVAITLAHETGTTSTYSLHLLVFVVVLPLWLGSAQMYGLYDLDDQRPDHSTVDDVGRVFQLVAVGTWLTVAAIWVFTGESHLATGVAFFATAIPLLIGLRACTRAMVRHHPDYRQNTLIVGAGEVGQLVARKLVQHPEFGIRVVGFVDSDPKKMRGDLEEFPILGSPSEIIDIATRNNVQRVIVAFSNDRHDLLVNLVRSLRELDVQIDLVPRLFEAVGPIVDVHVVEGLPLISLAPARHSRLARKVKRLGDILLAGGVLVIALPLFAFIAWRISSTSQGPVFFRQRRLGKDQKPFTLLKFRTMVVETNDSAHREYIREIMDPNALPTENSLYKLDRSSEITKAGAWLRRTSLDELPSIDQRHSRRYVPRRPTAMHHV